MEDRIRTSGCERARTCVSLSLDEELSELERRLLDAHLTRCVACAAFAAQVASVVRELRSTPLEPVTGSLTSPAWRYRPAAPAIRVAGRMAAVAAAAAAGIAMFSLGAGTVGNVEPADSPPPIILDATSSDTAQEVTAFRQMRRATLLSTVTQQQTDEISHSGPNSL